MEIRAYSEEYLEYAQRNLGNMLDFAVNTLGIDADEFFDYFIKSGIAKQFGKGNPKYTVGKTGCEIARDVMEKNDKKIKKEVKDVMYIDKSPEYWCGWIIAYYQWMTGKSFKEIYQTATIKKIIELYPTMHEADVTRFISYMNKLKKQKFPQTKLKRIRENLGISQRQLEELSGVPIRQIQLFEQRQRDINKTQAGTLLKFAKALHCDMEDLME